MFVGCILYFLVNVCYVQRLHLPNLKRNKSENLMLNLTFELPLFLQPCNGSPSRPGTSF